MMQTLRFFLFVSTFAMMATHHAMGADLQIAVFNADVSPPVGSVLAYDPVKGIQTPLRCKGIVLIGADAPIVLCAVDWIGIGNAGYSLFRETIAKAANTTPDRVAVHTLHQHDAPWCDPSIDAVLIDHNIPYRPFDTAFAHEAMRSVTAQVSESLNKLRPVTHVGTGKAIVEKVASNRRILGPDGRVQHVRWSAAKDPEVRAFPEGLIDPTLKMISFWDGDTPLAAISYYATHPQSYYRTGLANPDFPGLARNMQEDKMGIPLIHFNGAGGNITAGKYNDGSPENRQVLANRVATAMELAWKSTEREPIAISDVTWQSESIQLPLAPHLNKDLLNELVADNTKPAMSRFVAATKLVWIERSMNGEPILLSSLKLGKNQILHMPGELFIEFQLAAQKLRPDLNVMMAAYGEYGPEYIGTAISYTQGGYETGPDASLVGPGVEAILMSAIAKLLNANPSDIQPL
jgi:hypothetical protein